MPLFSSTRQRFLVLSGLLAVALLVIALVQGGNDSDSSEVSSSSSAVSSSTTSVAPDTSDGAMVIDVVKSLRPSSPVGFATEAYAALEDPGQVLPVGATVIPMDESLVLDGQRAMVDAVVSAPGGADSKYWLFLEQRDGQWVVTGTIELEP